jgi:type II secretory pathway pseudopilin PulG
MRHRTLSSHSRGTALVIALIVLAIAAVVALAGARSTIFGLRVAQAGTARLQLRVAAENAIERALRSAPPAAGSTLAFDEGDAQVLVRVDRDRRLPLGMAPTDGYGVGLGGAGFGAEHYTARAVATGRRSAVLVVEQQFYLLVPEGP